MDRIDLQFVRGTITISGNYDVPHTEWDDRTGEERSLALHYRDILEHLDKADIPYEDHVLDLIPCPELRCDIDLRPYQEEALDGLGENLHRNDGDTGG